MTLIQRYAVVVIQRSREDGTWLMASNLPRKRAVRLAKQAAGRNVQCERGCLDFVTGRYHRTRSGTTLYRGDDAWVMVEALAPMVVDDPA